jgi:hypothetical protein
LPELICYRHGHPPVRACCQGAHEDIGAGRAGLWIVEIA